MVYQMASNRQLIAFLNEVPKDQCTELVSFLALSNRRRSSHRFGPVNEADELLVTISLTRALKGRQN